MKMNMKLKVNILFGVLLSFFISGCGQDGFEDTKAIRIKNSYIKVEVAQTRAERTKGLSGRTQLAKGEGMLFLFPDYNVRTFWMKEMYIPIDIIWIKDNVVKSCAENVQPPEDPFLDEAFLPVYESNDIVNNVLEVKAGFCEQEGIEGGEIIEYFNI